jgi:hypothetical protein
MGGRSLSGQQYAAADAVDSGDGVMVFFKG